MDIKAIIRELLFEHDCVIIPGFGGFIGNFSPARHDRATGMFYPPVKQISFNRSLNHNDGLLISKISRVSGLNYGDSRKLAEEFAKVTTDRLDRGERVIFEHIGTFFHNRENKIQFEPEPNINYHAGSFGLEPFQYLPDKGYDVRKGIFRRLDKEPVMIHHSRRNLWRAAVIIPLLALLVAVPLKTDLFKTKVEATSLNPLVTAEFESNRMAVDEELAAISFSGTADTAVEPEPVTEVIPVPDISTRAPYGIITGSFKSEKNAMVHLEILESEGFVPEINLASNGFYRVTATRCVDLEAAITARDKITRKFPNAWIARL